MAWIASKLSKGCQLVPWSSDTNAPSVSTSVSDAP